MSSPLPPAAPDPVNGPTNQPGFSGGFSTSGQSAPSYGNPPGQSAPAYGTPPGGAPSPGAPWQSASGQAPVGGQPPSKKRWLPWAIGGCGCLVLLAIVAIVLFFVFVIGSTSGPRNAVETYEQAWIDGTCEGFLETTTDDFNGGATCEDFEYAASTIEDYEYTITETSVSGKTAEVSVEESYTYYGEKASQTGTYYLVKEDGEWLIDSSTVD
ncbi:hypothetical protein ACXET9_15890 [Brachybacterium sp. DNPG3]